MADNFISGVSGLVTVGVTHYSFGKWKAQLKCHLPNVNNFNDAPYQMLVAGILSATLTIDGPYNAGNMPFTAGVSYTWILGWTDALSLTVSAFIESIEPTHDVDDAARISITAQSSGPFAAAIT